MKNEAFFMAANMSDGETFSDAQPEDGEKISERRITIKTKMALLSITISEPPHSH